MHIDTNIGSPQRLRNKELKHCQVLRPEEADLLHHFAANAIYMCHIISYEGGIILCMNLSWSKVVLLVSNLKCKLTIAQSRHYYISIWYRAVNRTPLRYNKSRPSVETSSCAARNVPYEAQHSAVAVHKTTPTTLREPRSDSRMSHAKGERFSESSSVCPPSSATKFKFWTNTTYKNAGQRSGRVTVQMKLTPLIAPEPDKQ